MRTVLAILALAWTTSAMADGNVDASWIWFDEGNPAESAPSGDVWFRREVRVGEPSTCQVRIAVDDSFTLWVNGKQVGQGSAGKVHRFNLNGIVSEGINVFALKATNKTGAAGLLLEGVIRGQGGSENPIDSGAGWLATRQAPAGDAWLAPKFSNEGWAAAKIIAKHADSPWKDLSFAETYLDRYFLADGLSIERICEPEIAGSIVAMTWGNRRKIYASQERGPIVVLSDNDGDGKFESATPYSEQVKDCQGILVVGTNVYAVGNGSDGTGLFLLPDENQDDKADAVRRLHRYIGGMGEHGPHAVVLGPDGQLYNCVGNHAGVRGKRQENSPYRHEVEGYLLTPKYEDGRGHAAGIKAPGGTVWRFSPDGEEWSIETGGFRNEYDIAFNIDGELFTFDSDMEWDIGEPWYRPVRVNHCTAGAEFGWRSGAAKWPANYFDSLPATADIGRGSPTGVVFYEHTLLPKKYQGSLLICDWSMGRVIAVPMDPKGASFDGSRFETIVTGNPLNVSDIEVAPDGAILLATGGRGTEGGIYRITPTGAKAETTQATSISDLLNLPQPSAAWAREIAASVKAKDENAWQSELEKTVKDSSPEHQIRALTLLSQLGPAPSGDLLLTAASAKSPRVRAFATWLLGYHPSDKTSAKLAQLLADGDPRVERRACEAFIRGGMEAPVDPLLKLIASPDRFLSFTARLALERVPTDKWKEKVLSSTNDRVHLHGMLALLRQRPAAISAQEITDRVTTLWEKGTDQKYEALRLAQLAALEEGFKPAGQKLGPILLKQYPLKDALLNREAVRLIAKYQTQGATDILVAALEKEKNQEEQVHLALCLRYLDEGWNTDLKTRYVNWYNTSNVLDGGHSFEPYLENIVSGSFPRLTPEERKSLIASWSDHPYAARLLLRRSEPGEIADFAQIVVKVLEQSDAPHQAPYASDVYDLALDLVAKSDDPKCQELLRKLFDDNPDRRDKLAAKLAQKPTPESRPYLIRSLSFASDSTLGFVLRALNRLHTPPEKPEEVRQVIIAGLRLGENGGKAATELLASWTKEKPTGSIPEVLAHYQTWFASAHPNEPAAELPKVESTEEKFTVAQIMEFIDKTPGDVKRGREMYTKAQCIKCHKFAGEGQGIGPDLTTLRKRFQKKEIVEAILSPSAIVSDQYRTVTVVTVDGLVQTGMLASQENQENVVLWLNNGERAEFKKDEIEEQKPSVKSLMPPGLLKDLTLQDVADLFAFLETSKSNTEPGQTTASAGGGK